MAKPSTQTPAAEHLLETAERLLLQHGYDQVSIRAINSAAGMNPAAVHYHFGSKAALIGKLLDRRMAPLRERQLERLDQLGRRQEQPRITELVDLVMYPLAEFTGDPAGRARLGLLARVVLGRAEVVWPGKPVSLAPWSRVLRAARPDLAPRETNRRIGLMFELLLRVYSDPEREAPRPGRASFRTVHAFLTAGLDAP